MAFVVHFNDGRDEFPSACRRCLAKVICVPMRARLPGRIMAHQSFGAFSSSSNISNFPPVWALTPRKPRRNHARIVQHQHVARRAEIPANRGNRRCSIGFRLPMQNQQARFVAPGAGCCAISSGGRSKSKSAVRIARVSSFKPEVSSRERQFRHVQPEFRIVNNF